MKKTLWAFLAGAAALGALLAVYSYQSGPSAEPPTALREDFQVVRPVHVPEKVKFCGEDVPLDAPFVREALEREIQTNTYLHSHTLLVLKRVGRWKPMLSKILEEEKVPQDFFYLAVAESDLDPEAVSLSGAKGIWQFMEATGEEYGLQASRHVEMRRHPAASTRAFAAYVKKAKERFGSWTNAAASYNRGMNGYERAVEAQKQDSFYDLYLNSETARYVYRIIALKVILENPERYGYYLKKKDLYAPLEYDTLRVEETVEDLPAFAEKQGTNFRLLREYNPWLADVSSYRLPVPEGESRVLWLPKDRKKK